MRRHDKCLFIRQIAHSMPIIVHNCHTFYTFVHGTGFGNKHNLCIKISSFTGQAFINRIGHNVRHAAYRFLGCDQGLCLYLFGAINIPNKKFQFILTAFFHIHTRLDQNLGLDCHPGFKVRHFTHFHIFWERIMGNYAE